VLIKVIEMFALAVVRQGVRNRDAGQMKTSRSCHKGLDFPNWNTFVMASEAIRLA